MKKWLVNVLTMFGYMLNRIDYYFILISMFYNVIFQRAMFFVQSLYDTSYLFINSYVSYI